MGPSQTPSSETGDETMQTQNYLPNGTRVLNADFRKGETD